MKDDNSFHIFLMLLDREPSSMVSSALYWDWKQHCSKEKQGTSKSQHILSTFFSYIHVYRALFQLSGIIRKLNICADLVQICRRISIRKVLYILISQLTYLLYQGQSVWLKICSDNLGNWKNCCNAKYRNLVIPLCKDQLID